MFILFLLAIYAIISLIVGAAMTLLLWEPGTGLTDLVKIYFCVILYWPLILFSMATEKK
jgi:hypothetical protein